MKRYKIKEVKEPAILWRRAIAYIADILILGFLTSPLTKIVNLPQQGSFMETYNYFLSNPVISKEILIVGFIIGLITLLYFVILEFYLNQTLGKILMNIYVKSTKEKLILNQIIVRNIVKVSTVLLILDTLYIFIKKTHQRFTEKLSNTEVIQVRRKII